jgi:hypothetical protein
MDDRQDKSADFRRQAAACVEVAQRMSLHEDRLRMMEMAQRWLELAQKDEAAEAAQAAGQRQELGNPPPTPSSEHSQQPALQQQQAQPKDDGGA